MSIKELKVRDKIIEEDLLQNSIDRISNKFKGDCTEFVAVGNMPKEFDSKLYEDIESNSTITDNDLVRLLDEI